MRSFRRRSRAPKLVSDPDPGRQELLRSQLNHTLGYGWKDRTSHDGRRFFDSLEPASDPRHLTDALTERI